MRLAQINNLTNEQIYELYLQEKNERYLDLIAVKNKNYIRSLANDIVRKRAFYNNFLDSEDLEQEGYLGFREGLNRYNIETKNKIITYCRDWAKKYMFQYCDKNEKLVYHPQWVKRAVAGAMPKSMLRTDYNLSVVKNYNESLVSIEDVEIEERVSLIGNVNYDYLRLIASQFSEIENSYIDLLWDNGVSAFKTNKKVKEVVSKIKDIYETLKSEALFVLPLERNGEFLMSVETYDFWQNGTCGDKYHRYNANDIYKIEKERIGFIEKKISNNFINLKIER